MCFALVLLIFSIGFFAGMSALVIHRARQEARRQKGKKLQVSPNQKRRRSFC
jgi:hypothetical protein